MALRKSTSSSSPRMHTSRPALLHLPPFVTTGCASDKYLMAVTKSSARMPHSRRLRPCRAERSHSDHSLAALSVIVDASTISFGRSSGSGYIATFGGTGVGDNISSGRTSLASKQPSRPETTTKSVWANVRRCACTKCLSSIEPFQCSGTPKALHSGKPSKPII